MLKNKKNNFGGGKRIVMAGEEFGTVRVTGSGVEVDGIINLDLGHKMTAEEAEEIDRQIRSQIEEGERRKTFNAEYEERVRINEAEHQKAVAAGEKETAAQRFDRAMAEGRAEKEAARQRRINLFGSDVPEPGEEMYNHYDKLQPEGQQNAARMRLEKIGIEPTEDNIRAEIRVGLKKENVNDDFATEWNQRARSQSVVNKDVTLRQSRQQAVEDEAAMRSERFKKLAAEREELDRKIAERNAAREAAEAKFEESIGPARAAREAEAAKKPTGQLRGTLTNPKTSGLTVGTPVQVKSAEAARDVAKNADLPKITAAQDIIDARMSGEAPLNRSQIRALEDAYKARGGDDLSLLKLMGDDGDNFFQEEMDKLALRKNGAQAIQYEVPEPTGLVNFTDKDLADDFAPGTSPKPKPASARNLMTGASVDEFDPALLDYDEWRKSNLSTDVKSLNDAERSRQRSSRLREIFGSDADAVPAVKVGTPVDDLTKVVSTAAPVSPPVATAADMAASVEGKVAAAVVDGGTSTADNVVSSAVNRASTAVSGLKPKSAGGVLGLALGLAAGGAGVLYMHKNRGRPDYRGA